MGREGGGVNALKDIAKPRSGKLGEVRDGRWTSLLDLRSSAGLIIAIMSPVLFTPEKECYTVLIL